jgi:hypothetical protein
MRWFSIVLTVHVTLISEFPCACVILANCVYVFDYKWWFVWVVADPKHPLIKDLGDLALSCNPSYLGGQNSGMAWGVHTSPRQRKEVWVRIMGFHANKWPRCIPEVPMTKLGLRKHYSSALQEGPGSRLHQDSQTLFLILYCNTVREFINKISKKYLKK